MRFFPDHYFRFNIYTMEVVIVVIVQRFWTVYPRLVTLDHPSQLSIAAVRSNISDAGNKRCSSPISVSVVQGSLTSTVVSSATAKQVGSLQLERKRRGDLKLCIVPQLPWLPNLLIFQLVRYIWH